MSASPVLVTGVTGALGRALTARLRSDGAHVIGTSRVSDPNLSLDEFVAGDARGIDWTRLVASCRTVFHLAAFVHRAASTPADVELAYALNRDVTAAIARACREMGVRLVFASTVAVYGTVGGGPVREARAPVPLTPYGRSKLEGEEAVRLEGQRGLQFAILRFPLLYGPHGRGNMEKLVGSILRGRYLPIGSGDVRKSCVFFTDAADALVRASQGDAALGKVWNVASEPAPSLSEIHRAAYRAAGRAPPPFSIPASAARVSAWLVDWLARLAGKSTRLRDQISTLTAEAWYDGSAFASATGFVPRVSLEQGMEMTAQWIKGSQA